MAAKRFVQIGATRHDITSKPIITEELCDRCGAFLALKTAIAIPARLAAEAAARAAGDGPTTAAETASHIPAADPPVPVELCHVCVKQHFPGLLGLAVKVTSRD